MKGDFSRHSFRPSAEYTGVRLQQGRVLLDADWNEHDDIDTTRARTALADVIGRAGTPAGEDGFRIEPSGEDLIVHAGRFYVDGIAVTNPEDFVLDPPGAAGEYGVYLDVHEVLVTALEDPALREVALLGPDHAVRRQVRWSIGYEPVTGETPGCAANDPGWTPSARPPTSARIQARSQQPNDANDPCILPSEAGYRGLENHLFRVEVHHVGQVDGVVEQVTWKWDDDNASMAVRWDDPTITVTGPTTAILGGDFAGRAVAELFTPGDLLELTTDDREFDGQPGYLLRLASIQGSQLVVVQALDPLTVGEVDLSALTVTDFTKIRRWRGVLQHELPIANPEDRSPGRTSDWVALPKSAGVEVELGPGHYTSGDYWEVPARTALGDVLWPPPTLEDDPSWAPPAGPKHHYAALAHVLRPDTVWQLLRDCRCVFDPLCDGGCGGCCVLAVEPGGTWDAPIRALVPGTAVRICFAPGDYELRQALAFSGGSVSIEGAGPATRILAPTLDSAFVFDGCESATVSTVHVETGEAALGGAVPTEVSGTLHFVECTGVHVHHASIRCGTAVVESRACIAVSWAAAEIGLVERTVHVEHNQLTVGDRQVGLRVDRGLSIEVVGNRIALDPESGVWTGEARLANDSRFRIHVLAQLIDELAVIRPDGAPTDLCTHHVPYGDDSSVISLESDAWFRTDAPIAPTEPDIWLQLADANGVSGPAEEFMSLLLELGERVLLQDPTLIDVDNGSGPLFAMWFKERLLTELDERAMSDGVVVVGFPPDRVLVRDNHIRDAIRGVRLEALEIRQQTDPDEPRVTEIRQAIVDANLIEVFLPADATEARYAIHATRANQVDLGANQVKLRRTSLSDQLQIEGAGVPNVRRWWTHGIEVVEPMGTLVRAHDNLAPPPTPGRSDFDVGVLIVDSLTGPTVDFTNESQPVVAFASRLWKVDGSWLSAPVPIRITETR